MVVLVNELTAETGPIGGTSPGIDGVNEITAERLAPVLTTIIQASVRRYLSQVGRRYIGIAFVGAGILLVAFLLPSKTKPQSSTGPSFAASFSSNSAANGAASPAGGSSGGAASEAPGVTSPVAPDIGSTSFTTGASGSPPVSSSTGFTPADSGDTGGSSPGQSPGSSPSSPPTTQPPGGSACPIPAPPATLPALPQSPVTSVLPNNCPPQGAQALAVSFSLLMWMA